MSLFNVISIKKKIKLLAYGKWGTGKTTFVSTAPAPRYWIDSEHSSDNIRDPKDKVLYTTSFFELQEAIKEIRNSDCVTLIIDPYTIFWQRLIDHVEGETKDGMQFRHWAKVKKPNARLITDLENLNCNVAMTAHEVDEYEMRPNEHGKLEPVKIGVKIDSEKKTAYAPDVVIRLAVEKGIHVCYIEKIRARKEIVLKHGLTVGSRWENPDWSMFSVIANEFESGDQQAKYDDDRTVTQKDEKVFENLENEQEQVERQKLITRIEKVEAKARKMGLYGWRDDSEIESSRKTMLGADGLNTDLEILKQYGNSVRELTTGNAGKVD